MEAAFQGRLFFPAPAFAHVYPSLAVAVLLQLRDGQPNPAAAGAGCRIYDVKALEGFIQIYGYAFIHHERAYAANGMADEAHRVIVGEHACLYAEFRLETGIVYLCVTGGNNEDRAIPVHKGQGFGDAGGLAMQSLCSQCDRCGGYIKFKDAVSQPDRSKIRFDFFDGHKGHSFANRSSMDCSSSMVFATKSASAHSAALP